MKLIVSRYLCTKVGCVAWLNLLKVGIIETKWNAVTKFFGLGKL